MSSTAKWVIAVLVIAAVFLGLWRGGFLGGGAATTKGAQGAGVLSNADGTPLIDASDATIARESAAINAQMKVAGNQAAAFSQAPTVIKADLLASQLGAVSALMNKLAARFQSRVSILKSMGFNTDVVQGALSDMNLQISYAVAQLGLAGQISASVKPDNGDSTQANKNSVALEQSKIEFQKSHSYLVAAQKDIKTAIDGFKSISASQPQP